MSTTPPTGPFPNSRAPFEPLEFASAPDDQRTGTSAADHLMGDPIAATNDLPGARFFWTFDDATGNGFDDQRGGPRLSTFELSENQAIVQAPSTRPGPGGTTQQALEFDGENDFAFIEHDPGMEVTQGTVALWVQPDNIADDSIILSKDQSGTVDGGHFRLGIEDGGHLFIRFAEGDGGSNKAWESSKSYFSEGEWTHIAVSFTDEGITVYADGVAVPDEGWIRREGNLDSPADASEAYLLQNQEPWFLGANTAGTKNNESPAEFAAETNHICDPFDGAIADFGFFGGFDSSAALNDSQVFTLFTQGPGTALAADNVPTILAGDDTLNGLAGNDVIEGGAGDDELVGGEGSDELRGGYGDDILDGGADNDVLEGGRGSDLLLGGAGDDTLISRSDGGEQRIGQLALDQATRGDPDNEVNPLRQKLYGWEDQPLIADDILVGGEGRDTFLFNPQINAKRDIILEHVNADRTINWAAVAGENDELHDHWVDQFGIDIIADYRADEDQIAIVGHTAQPTVEHRLIDTDGDGVLDEAISIITVVSQQHGGGGAHTQDLIGQIVVFGDLVDEEDLIVEARVTHGIVETVDELQEALAPSGETKVTTIDGEEVFGYDTRDANGNAGDIVENPHLFSDNPFLASDRFDFATNRPDDVPVAVAVIDAESHPALAAMALSGNGDDGAGQAFVNIAHDGRAALLAQTEGTIAFSFTADRVGTHQTLFSKDARNYVDGGHLTAWITSDKHVLVRYQSTDQTVYLKDRAEHIEAGETHRFAFSFDGDSAELYLDGELRDTEDLSDNPTFLLGMSGNSESLVFGASTTHRTPGEVDRLKDFFDGTIEDVFVADRVLTPVELFKLHAADNDFGAIGLNSTNELNTPTDANFPTEAELNPTSDPTELSDAEAAALVVLGTDRADSMSGNADNDVIDGQEGDDNIVGNDGYDTLLGGAGNDRLDGGAGNDMLMGGRGSDLLLGGAGDDLLVSRADTGEQRIGQLAINQATRGDPDNEVNPERQKLFGYEGQPLVGDDILIGGEGKDTFLLAPEINAKREIIEKHTREDGTINWSRVAHENDELHDHWVDNLGIDIIGDYDASEDHIAVIGHTANVSVEHRDVDNDGDDESIITIYSQQGGGGGAHTQDIIGQAIVFGDLVEEDDIKTDAGVTYGIVENIADIEEAINPAGTLKVSVGPNGETISGYDSRDANGNLGPILSNPENYVDNPFLDEVTFANPGAEQGPNDSSRAPFEQLAFTAAPNDNIVGTNADDELFGDAANVPSASDDLPGARFFWRFDNGDQGLFGDARGGPPAAAYELFENQALLRVAPSLRDGPNGSPNGALEFNGENTFGFIAHDPSMEITQGTISLWVQPDDVSDDSIILSKDERGSGDGGHFRLGIDDGGRLFLRFADGDGSGNKSWVSTQSYFEDGEWTHVAVSFTDSGITVYANGVAIPDEGWARREGNLDSPADDTEAFLLQNAEPWILGADTSGTRLNDTAAEFATDDEHLDDAFDGAIADFGIFGGFTPADALDANQVFKLFVEGPGAALTADNVPTIAAGNDTIDGAGGNDEIDGGAGNDELIGGEGNDELRGGYGDDILDGGADNDVLEGGHGSDLLLGGDGDDVLISRSDGGEQRIGQLAIGQPTRDDPDNEVNPLRQKLYGWEDQPLIADDVLVGGAGRDTFLFNPQINAKRDIILEHVNADRTINWAAVAGENDELHDHWVDQFGIDIIADYRADEDEIAIVGHTAVPTVEHRLIDTDGDGILDEAISIITVISQQHGGGGAHTQDLIGQIVVFGDLVDEDALITNDRVTHGIVDTVDELQLALAPSGETKTTTIGDEIVTGYDTRDAEGNLGAIVENPHEFSDNPFLDSDRFELASNLPEGMAAPAAVIDALSRPILSSMTFSGDGEDGEGTAFVNIDHIGQATGLAQTDGTIAFRFTADNPNDGFQALFSKDASGFQGGGHLTAWITPEGNVKVRYQSTEQSVYLKVYDVDLVAGESHHFAFSFDENRAELYLDGQLRDVETLSDRPAFAAGMSGNAESLVFGASAISRPTGTMDRLRDFFDGKIEEVAVFDRKLLPAELFKLAQGELEADVSIADDLELIGTNAADVLAGEDGNDLIQGMNGHDQLTGAGGNDEIDGGRGHDVIDGGAGNDKIAGGLHNDRIEGGLGDDEIDAGGGRDTVHGGEGNDVIEAGSGRDTVHGGEGNDVISGGRQEDFLFGDAGDDELRGGHARDRIQGGEGNDIILGEHGNDRLEGGLGDDEIDGGIGNDLLSGNEGNDILIGGEGRDHLNGGADNDILIGGAGNDIQTGGAGADHFRFDLLSSDSLGLDVIRDFSTGEDKLQIASELDISVDARARFSFVSLADSEGETVGQIRIFGEFNEDTDIVRFDTTADTLL